MAEDFTSVKLGPWWHGAKNTQGLERSALYTQRGQAFKAFYDRVTLGEPNLGVGPVLNKTLIKPTAARVIGRNPENPKEPQKPQAVVDAAVPAAKRRAMAADYGTRWRVSGKGQGKATGRMAPV